jgi:hypothetical protein
MFGGIALARKPKTSGPAADQAEPGAERVEIDIEDVGPDTRVADLTVAQLVQLLVQIRAEEAARPARNRRRAEAIARLIERFASDDENVAAVKNALAEIGRKLPAVLIDIAKEMGKGKP